MKNTGNFLVVVTFYIGLFVAIGIARPRVCMQLLRMWNQMLHMLIFMFGVMAALLWSGINPMRWLQSMMGMTVVSETVLFEGMAVSRELLMMAFMLNLVLLVRMLNTPLMYLCKRVLADQALEQTQHQSGKEHGDAKP